MKFNFFGVRGYAEKGVKQIGRESLSPPHAEGPFINDVTQIKKEPPSYLYESDQYLLNLFAFKLISINILASFIRFMAI